MRNKRISEGECEYGEYTIDVRVKTNRIKVTFDEQDGRFGMSDTFSIMHIDKTKVRNAFLDSKTIHELEESLEMRKQYKVVTGERDEMYEAALKNEGFKIVRPYEVEG
jgi:hypothetical protein